MLSPFVLASPEVPDVPDEPLVLEAVLSPFVLAAPEVPLEPLEPEVPDSAAVPLVPSIFAPPPPGHGILGQR